MQKNLFKVLIAISVTFFGGILNGVTAKPISNLSIPFFNSLSETSDTINNTPTNQVDLDRLADSLTQKVLGENKVVDMLDPEKVYTLPIGIVKQLGGVYYTIVLDNLKFTPTGAELKAYMSLSFPGSTKKIGLVADKVKIGINGIEAAQLKMLKDKPIPLMNNNELLINADSTFIEWDCNGYKQAQLSATIFLDESKFYKINSKNGNIITGAKVSGKILCSVTNFNDIMLNISLDPFQVKGLKDFSFYPTEIVLDLSDTQNCQSMQFPNDYQSVFFDGNNKNLWRGVFIKSFKLKFPQTFAKSGPPPEIEASNFLIDIQGISGSIAYNSEILSFDQGNLGGWKFSVNSIGFSFIQNDISGFSMKGGIILPVGDSKKPLNYTASIDADENFLFSVTFPDKLNAPLFGSGTTLTLASNSKITVQSIDGHFYPKAELHGKMSINVGENPGTNLADVDFQGLVIQTRAPKIKVQAFALTSGAMAGFPIQVNSIVLEHDKKDSSLLGLNCDVTANLMKEKIVGNTSFVIWAQNNDQDWKYNSFELRKIGIDANTGAFSLKGVLVNYKNNTTYGNGYYGKVEMSINPGINVNATAQFGNVSDYRYWFADAGVSLPSGIPIFSGFGIYGFGGGAYYHMERTVPVSLNMSADTTQNNNTITIGESQSGIIYKPSKTISLGIMAKVIVGTHPNAAAFNGSVAFGVEFNSDQGVNKIYFEGDGRFMTDLSKPPSDAKVRAGINIQYVFSKHELSGYANAFINVEDVITGANPGNLAGQVDFYFASKEWYVYVGTPTNPVGLKLMKSIKTTGYFMVGTTLPDFPPLPAKLGDIANKIDFSNLRSSDQIKEGGGFAFGASISTDTGEQEFLIFYGSFNMGVGFDFMLKNFGESARCEGHSGSLGINGWYAQGQAWAYINAKIGVKVKVFRHKKKFNFLDAGFAAVLAAQLPNPTYLAGAVEAHYSVLGGMVKGKCHFEFSMGEQCKITGASAVEGIDIIAEVSPSSGSNDVDVFVTPQTAFNIPIDKEFEILDTDGKNKKFKAVLDYFNVTQKGSIISCNTTWNNNHDVVVLRPVEILPGETQLKAKVKIHFMALESGKWSDYKVDGKVEGEEREIAFTTGEAPDYITENNVEYSYPVKNMVNFYKNEYENLSIKVYQGINYLFTKTGNWRYEAHFTSGENVSKVPITYNSDKKQVEFYVPDNLKNETIYDLQILRVENSGKQFVADKNVKKNLNMLASKDTVTTKSLEGSLSDESTTKLYELHFRTSKFNTFVDKMKRFGNNDAYYSEDQGYKILIKYFNDAEIFDEFEMNNIKIDVSLNNKWYNNNYRDLIYTNYPLKSDVTITHRDPKVAGIPPIYSAFILQPVTPPSLTEQDISSNTFHFEQGYPPRINYILSYYVIDDWFELRNKSYKYRGIAVFNKIIDFEHVGFPLASDYLINIRYFVPSNSEPTSVYVTKFEY